MLLFSKIAEHCAKRGEPLIFPTGSYGHFIACAQFHGAKITNIPSDITNQFKLDPHLLEQALSKVQGRAWVILTAPIVNPTGAIYSDNELEAIIKIVAKNKSILILDSIFSGLEFASKPTSHLVNPKKYPNLKWVVLGGLSKEFAGGGLRMGYAITSDIEIYSLWRQNDLYAPHAILKFITKKLYRQLLDNQSELISELLEQKKELKLRSEQLIEVLKQNHWAPLEPSGGLFLSATPSDSKHVDGLEKRLREKMGVIINPPSWTGISNYFRFVLSTSRSEFDDALKRLRDFKFI